MHLKLFLKRNSIFIFIFFSTFCNAQSPIKNADVQIIAVAMNTKDMIEYKSQLARRIWVLYFIVIDEKVFSGDIFIGYNFTCKSDKEFYNKNENFIVPPDETMFFVKKMDEMKYKHFKTNIPVIDTNFYYKSLTVPIEYLEAPCTVDQPNFFKFIFNNNYNGLYITKMNLKKTKESNFPKFFLDEIMKNEKCLKVLVSESETSYLDYEKCLR